MGNNYVGNYSMSPNNFHFCPLIVSENIGDTKEFVIEKAEDPNHIQCQKLHSMLALREERTKSIKNGNKIDKRNKRTTMGMPKILKCFREKVKCH